MFLEAKGNEIKKNIIFQDIESTIRMANNGRDTCTGNSRHINLRHLFVKDRVDKGEIEVKYFPTNLMLDDYFTKLLQGKMFKSFLDLIMGYVHINYLLQAIKFSAKERVDKSKMWLKIQSLTMEKEAMLTFAKPRKRRT